MAPWRRGALRRMANEWTTASSPSLNSHDDARFSEGALPMSVNQKSIDRDPAKFTLV